MSDDASLTLGEEQSYPVAFGEVQFSEREAADAFCRIAGKFYERNFGVASKTEIELVMFEILAEKTRGLSDLALAKRLGITPQMVSNRRTKLALRNDLGSCDWAASLLEVLDSRTYVLRETKSGCEMKILFSSKMAVYEFEDALKGCGHYFDNSFNSLVVVTPMSAVFDLLFQEMAGLPMPKGCENPGPGGYIKYCFEKRKIKDPQVREAIAKLWKSEACAKTSAVVKGIGKSTVRIAFSTAFKNLTIDQVANCATALYSIVDSYIEDSKPAGEKGDGGEGEGKRSDSFPIQFLNNIKGIAKCLTKREELVVEEGVRGDVVPKER
ncbi:hypothetical protein [Adlercreutzia shanghongiae]|uniref:MarR family transcriptional regulator n=1 Tax=Adlercreutzia shanghongiae TaxID=3111773 RepID=A0ABU6J0I4_9ACTN|nr:hypothetical protein [Adlercreutzia sp. R22]MEC4295639.1 hypothetical protein [Adlercreutzia sp. R22]